MSWDVFVWVNVKQNILVFIKLFIKLLTFSWTSCVSHLAQRSRGKTMMVPCDTEYPAFVSERTIKETTGNIDCDECIRYQFKIMKIIKKNDLCKSHSTAWATVPIVKYSSFCVACRSFVIQQIPSSNLFMVVVDNKCDCSSIPPVTMDPIEIMYILSILNRRWDGDGGTSFVDVLFKYQLAWHS